MLFLLQVEVFAKMPHYYRLFVGLQFEQLHREVGIARLLSQVQHLFHKCLHLLFVHLVQFIVVRLRVHVDLFIPVLALQRIAFV
jgi:hypothetical protein